MKLSEAFEKVRSLAGDRSCTVGISIRSYDGEVRIECDGWIDGVASVVGESSLEGVVSMIEKHARQAAAKACAREADEATEGCEDELLRQGAYTKPTMAVGHRVSVNGKSAGGLQMYSSQGTIVEHDPADLNYPYRVKIDNGPLLWFQASALAAL